MTTTTPGGTAAHVYATAARLRGQRIADEARAHPSIDRTVWDHLNAITSHVAESAYADTKLGAFAHADAAHAHADAAQAYVAYHSHGGLALHLLDRLTALDECAARADEDTAAIDATAF